MHIVRFVRHGDDTSRVGVLNGQTVTALEEVDTLAQLWHLTAAQLRETLVRADGPQSALSEVILRPPIDGDTEVWACGVTYRESRTARMKESDHEADIYERVYQAARPELFFKSVSWRVVGEGEPIAVRADSAVNVPEAELALVINSSREVVGYTVCNDVSSRSIEGENPLYFPQAKVYLGACAIGPTIRPSWEIADPYDLKIDLSISSGQEVVWEGSASTSQLHRRFHDLVDYLHRADVFPDGAMLSTGTCLVPPLPFSLSADHLVTITIAEVGQLTNPVVDSLQAMSWLAEARGAAIAAPGN